MSRPKADVVDVASFILERQGPMTAMKLQKLTYYSQVWHLIWVGRPLFEEEFEAWVNGPVSPRLFSEHRGRYSVTRLPAGNSALLTQGQKATVERVLDSYGNLEASRLSALTHSERPWRDARGSAVGRSSAVIEKTEIMRFYCGKAGKSGRRTTPGASGK